MLKLLGRIAAVFGLLKLLQDANISNLTGLFLEWITAYNQFIDVLRNTVFFPIRDLLTTSEINILIIITAALGAVLRAVHSSYQKKEAKPKDFRRHAFAHSAVIALLPFFILLVSNDVAALTVAVLWLILICLTYMTEMSRDPHDTLPSSREVRRETGWVVIYLLLVIGLNYVLF